MAGPRAESLSSESVRGLEKVTGEGASHDARGGRAPTLQHSYGLEVGPGAGSNWATARGYFRRRWAKFSAWRRACQSQISSRSLTGARVKGSVC